MSDLACAWCEDEWNMDPVYGDEDTPADGLPFCCEDCRAAFNKQAKDDERWLNQYEPDAEPYKGRT